MIESGFRKDLQKGLRAQGALCIKLPDLSRGQLKPCDLIMGYQRQLFLLELKLTKLNRKRPIGDEDVVIARKQFRPHQLPTLWDAIYKQQAHGYAAVCLVNEQQRGQKWAWMLPALHLRERDEFTFGELTGRYWKEYQLQWVPTVGWQWPRLGQGGERND